MRIVERYTGWAGAALALAALAAAQAAGTGGKREPAWTQWGGPDQEFTADSSGLAASWPETGPRKLWSRELGEGYSAILAEDGRLYTMYRTGEQEAVICLDAADGKTIWEHRYAAAPRPGHVVQFGSGPRATPLIVGGRLYAVGIAGTLHALDKNDGKVAWTHELWGDSFGGNVLEHGYASSPIASGELVYVLVGGEGGSIVALKQKDGAIAWRKHTFDNSYSTPRILNIAGKQELVTFMAHELVGLDPRTGELTWSYAHENEWGQNINMPMMADPNHLFLSSPQSGAAGLGFKRGEDGRVQVQELWATRKIQFYHVSSVRDGDYVYGSTGTMGPAFLAAVNIKTGEIAWRERGFAKANLVRADGRVLILDEDGNLGLATASPQGLAVHARVQLLEKVAWTVPTVVGHTLFVRDQKAVSAFDLG